MVETATNLTGDVQTLEPKVSNQVHISTRGGLTFFKDKLITAGDDTMLKFHEISSGTPCESGEPFDLDCESYALSSDLVSTIAVGGEDKKAYIYKVLDDGDSGFKVEEKEIAMCFDSPVTKLQFVAGGSKLLAVSQDKHVQLMDIESKKVTNFVKSAHDGSVRNAAVDTHCEYLATTGTECDLKITKISGSDHQLVKTIKLQKKGGLALTSNQWLDIAWSSNGDHLFYAGGSQLGFMTRSDNFAKEHLISTVSHQKDISLVQVISQTCIATASLDKWVKVWHVPETSLPDNTIQIRLVCKFKVEKELIQLTYSQESKQLAYMDSECTIGLVQLTDAIISGDGVSADDIDLDAIDAAMADDDDNIDMDDMKDALDEAQSKQDADDADKQAAAVSQQESKPEADNLSAENIEEPEKPQQKKKVSFQADTTPVKSAAPLDTSNYYGHHQSQYQVGLDTQTTFLSNCVPEFVAGKHKILSWNTIGVVGVRTEFQYTVVDIDFANKNFHRNLVLNDVFGVTMAAMNYNGVLLASQAEEKNEDQYEDDLAEDNDMDQDDMFKRRKNSNIQYKPFNEWKDVKEWNFELKNGESVECLAVGSGWNAVLTNFNYIRVFSNNGAQKDLISQAHPVVSMAGYEQFLAIVYQSGPAFNGYQPMKLKIINMQARENQVLIDADCAVTPTSELRWFGFSEEGQLFSYDGLGVVRSFSFTSQTWTPRHDFKIRHGHMYRQLWITGVSEQELLVIEMPKDHEAPSIAQKNNVRRFKMKLPLLDIEQDTPSTDATEMTLTQIEAKLQAMWLHLDHEQFRKLTWESLKHFRSKYDNEFAQSETILDNAQITEMKRANDKEVMNAIRVCIMADEKEKIFDYMDQMNFSQSLKLVVKMCDKLKAPELAQKVNKFLTDKETKEVFMKQIPQEKHQALNLQGRRVPASNNPVSFSEQFKNDKPALIASSQASQAASTSDAALARSKIEAKTNPFQKKAAGGVQGGASSDVFSDLQKTSKLDQMSQSLLNKRPFNGGVAQPSKQRKLFNNAKK